MRTMEPLAPSATDRLHNSGPTRGLEQYRTPPIVSQFSIPLRELLSRWDRLDPESELVLRCAADKQLTRAHAAQCVAMAVESLTGERPRQSSDLRVTCKALLDAAQTRGLIEGIVLSCARVPASPVQWRGEGTVVDDTTVALALLAYAYAQPPMVMWTGEPTGRFLTDRGMLMVQWMQGGRAGAAARSAWSELVARKPVPRGGQ